jgi:hypothetical protein
LVDSEKKQDDNTVSGSSNGTTGGLMDLIANELHMGARPGSLNILWIIPAAKDFITGRHERSDYALAVLITLVGMLFLHLTLTIPLLFADVGTFII